MPRGAPFDLLPPGETNTASSGPPELLARAFRGWNDIDWWSSIEDIRAATAGDAAFAVTGEDRALFAASILATAAGAPPLVVLPSAAHSTISSALEAVSFQRVLGAATAPAGVEPLPRLEHDASVADLLPVTEPRAAHERCVALFTGGSTGGRRLWWKTLDNLFSEAATLAALFGITSDDVIVGTVPPCHIYGLLLTCLVPMVTGARVVRDTPRLPEDIARTVEQERATVLVSVPAHYAVLHDRRLSRVRLALSSAAALPSRVAESFFSSCSVVIHEIFGSTETGGMATRPSWPADGLFLPLPNIETRIEDEQLRVRSPFLSPDLPRDESGFFVTSDRVRAEGAGFAVLGRVDGVVKVGGRRIDLAAIEEAFRRIAAVEDVLVLALPVEQARGTEIAALVATSLSIAELRRQLGQHLEPSAIPHRIQAVAAIPRTLQGKVDRERVMALLHPQGSS